MQTDNEMKKDNNLISDNEIIKEDKIIRRIGLFAFVISIIGFFVILILLFIYVLFPNYKKYSGEGERGFAIDSVVSQEEQQ